MRKVIVSMVISLDGYTETVDKNMDWQPWGEDMTAYMDNFMAGTDTILLGRKAFELMEGYWPTEEIRIEEPVLAKRMNETHKLVFSTTRTTTNWENTSFADRIENEITKLKQLPGKDMVLFGGGELAATFMEKGLVDEYHIITSPIALGSGNPLFKQRTNLKLKKVQPMPSGNVVITYSS